MTFNGNGALVRRMVSDADEPSEPITARVAIVFGGSRGIGAEIALRLAEDGLRVALTYVSRADKADEVVGTIVSQGGEAIAIQADSADAGAIREAVGRCTERFGRLDVAVVNAGLYRHAMLDAVQLDELDLLLSVNVRGVFLAVQAAAGVMQDGGRIITIGSNAAIRTGAPGSSVYAMTKAALVALARSVALDLAPRRITVNNIQPGPIETDLTAPFVDHLVDRIPLRRLGKAAEIAELASYLAGDASAYMTGASLTIDGGFVL